MESGLHPSAGSNTWSASHMTPGRKLRLIQDHDRHKQWWTLEETRFCAKCDRLFIGRDIKVFEDGRGNFQFRCPTERCLGKFSDWGYPRLHL